MNRKIYLDTSVISALYDQRTPERMEMTKNAWAEIREYEVYISDLVVEELQMAKGQMLGLLNAAVEGFVVIGIDDEASALAAVYVSEGIFPEKYMDDAIHVAVATVNEIGLLLSWNFKHLVKLKTRRMVTEVNAANGYGPIEIIAPPEL